MNDPVKTQKQSKSSEKVQYLSARLSAVQAIYQFIYNEQPIKAVAKEYMDHRSDMEIDGEQLVKPDPVKFKEILYGVDERMLELEAIIQANLSSDEEQKKKNVEPLLKAVLLCGSYELMACQDTDSPIIINDYLNVAHAFFEKGEVGLINAVLDAIAKLFREEAPQA